MTDFKHPASALADAGLDPHTCLQVLYKAGFKILSPIETTLTDDPPIPDEMYASDPLSYERFGGANQRTFEMVAYLFGHPQDRVVSVRRVTDRYHLLRYGADYLKHLRDDLNRRFAGELLTNLGVEDA